MSAFNSLCKLSFEAMICKNLQCFRYLKTYLQWVINGKCHKEGMCQTFIFSFPFQPYREHSMETCILTQVMKRHVVLVAQLATHSMLEIGQVYNRFTQFPWWYTINFKLSVVVLGSHSNSWSMIPIILKCWTQWSSLGLSGHMYSSKIMLLPICPWSGLVRLCHL